MRSPVPSVSGSGKPPSAESGGVRGANAPEAYPSRRPLSARRECKRERLSFEGEPFLIPGAPLWAPALATRPAPGNAIV